MRIWVVTEHVVFEGDYIRGIYLTDDEAKKRKEQLLTAWPYDPDKKLLGAGDLTIRIRDYLCGESLSGMEHSL